MFHKIIGTSHTFQSQKRPSYGNVARSWEDILDSFDQRARENPALLPLLHLTQQIVSSPYPAAGLYGSTSMCNILIGRSADVSANPHLYISYDSEMQRFTLTYRDFTKESWTRTCSSEEVWPALERFLLRRVRWFKQATPFDIEVSTDNAI